MKVNVFDNETGAIKRRFFLVESDLKQIAGRFRVRVSRVVALLEAGAILTLRRHSYQREAGPRIADNSIRAKWLKFGSEKHAAKNPVRRRRGGLSGEKHRPRSRFVSRTQLTSKL